MEQMSGLSFWPIISVNMALDKKKSDTCSSWNAALNDARFLTKIKLKAELEVK